MSGPSPVFFLSYASGAVRPSGGRRDRHVMELFEELSEHLAELVPLPIGTDPGYLDRPAPAGRSWRAELQHALGTSQIFVALISPRYFQSEWCGREWAAFSSRSVHHRLAGPSAHHSTILPVLWVRSPAAADFPRAINEVQHFVPKGLEDQIVQQYQENGLLGLKLIGREDAFSAVTWRLAQRIAEMYHELRVEPSDLELDTLPNAFRESP